jgi:hypothetical protein
MWNYRTRGAEGIWVFKATWFNNKIPTFCTHSVFVCFVCIWEQTAIISLYNINWLVFIAVTGCVYCAVRSTFYVLPTLFIYVFCVDLRTNSDYFTVQHWLVSFYNWDGVCLLRGTFYILRSAHTVYLCVWCGSDSKQCLCLYTAFTHWVFKRGSLFTPRYGLGLQIRWFQYRLIGFNNSV